MFQVNTRIPNTEIVVLRHNLLPKGDLTICVPIQTPVGVMAKTLSSLNRADWSVVHTFSEHFAPDDWQDDNWEN